MDAFWRLGIQRLREQPGINVRLPSHTAAPFRAIPLAFSHTTNIAGPGGAPGTCVTARFGVQWNAAADSTATGFGAGNAFVDGVTFTAAGGVATAPLNNGEQFPSGLFGVIQTIDVLAFQALTTGTFAPYRQARWSALLDGQALPGYRFQMPSNGPDRGTTGSGRLVDVDGGMRMPLTIQPGQRLELAYHLANDVPALATVGWVALVRGYAYPSRSGVAGDIWSTLTD